MTGRAFFGLCGSGMVTRRILWSLAVGAWCAGLGLASLPAQAETLTERMAKKQQKAGEKKDKLLVESRELVYDKDKNTVSAVGNAQLYYQGRVLEADKVIYDRTTNRVFAQGNAKLTETNGQIVYGERFELTDDFKDGFIDSLRIDTVDKTHFVAPRGERTAGETTVFEKGTYTACDACKDDPSKPPLWQVRAKKIIHRNEERMVYYEDATIEFYGVPLAYIPYFSAPDSTVKRKSGFLAPRYITSSSLGFGVSMPYFWALAPNYDLTLTPTILSKQGLLGQAEWRHRLMNGSYNIRLTGIFQQDPSVFLSPPYGAGSRDFRGSVESSGKFLINDKWQWGWDITGATDRWFLQNYKYQTLAQTTQLSALFRENTSTVYLIGQGERSYAEARGYYFRGLTFYDWQKTLPWVGSVDYERRFTPPVVGGELSLTGNLRTVTRSETDFQSLVNADGITPGRYFFPIGYDKYGNPIATYESCAPGNFNPQKCYVRGMAGTSTRLTTEAAWRRTFIDAFGQSWTPFAQVRADLAFVSPDTSGPFNQYLPNFIRGESDTFARVMPAAGLTYRYPFVANSSFGTHVIEPIAQVIFRPNETGASRMPNEDSQSLVFDDTTLFATSKFSGYDRVEGGSRANVGAQYTWTGDKGGTVNALFGQSFQLFGQNSYALPSLARTGWDSGLDTKRSDYVARLQIAPVAGYSITARSRFDEATWALKRLEVQASAAITDKLTTSIVYSRYGAQPDLGLYTKREAIVTSARYQIDPNWYVSGGVLLDLSRHAADRFYQTAAQSSNPVGVAGVNVGAGYKDECTTFGIVYSSTGKTTLADGTKGRVQTVLLRLELRTLGSASYSYNISQTSTDGIQH